MDVSCERCKAEYEFDDSLLGEHGTTVKCSSCGHVFRVLPATKQPSRPSLKLRYQRDGRVEALSSLRDLQRRVHAGEVSIHDELGRDGFPWRKLSDVPELRSFFAKPSGASSSVPQPAADPARRPAALSVSQSSMPAPRDGTPSAKRTMLGVGPQNPQIPGPPRVPNVPIPGVASTAQAGAQPPKPASATSSQGPRVPAAGQPAAPTHAASDSDRPTDPPKNSNVTSARPRSVAPPATPSNPVPQLYLSEHEAPPARATESSSKIWIAAAVALVVVVAGAVAVTALRKGGSTPEPTAPPAGRIEAPTPAPSIAPEAQAATPTPSAPAPAAVAPTPAPSEQAAAPTPVPAQATGDESKKATSGTSGDKARDPSEEATPKDYGGWVAAGDSALGRGDAAAAEKAYTQALTLRASGSEAATGLGYALVTDGKPREAIPYFERAAKNGYAEASIGLGDAHKKLGNADAARKAYKSYLERLPGGSRAAYVEKQLAALGGGAGAAEPAEAKPEPEQEPAGSAEPEYRPAGELTEQPAGSNDEAAP